VQVFGHGVSSVRGGGLVAAAEVGEIGRYHNAKRLLGKAGEIRWDYQAVPALGGRAWIALVRVF
jgi:ribosomal protein L2